ncbi:DVU_1557 family redox protein [Azotosporobacter soli]|uniref:DVU_1557 family redox protein n=1 Tax=Azotosporobacter soli TaxID=3055040 RepID=UPI0031FF44C7
MSNQILQAEANIECDKCKVKLTLGSVKLDYLGSSFPVELYKCSQCGLVYVPEALATGKMKQVEEALEDK